MVLLQPNPVSGHGPASGQGQGAAAGAQLLRLCRWAWAAGWTCVRLLGIKAAVRWHGKGSGPH